MKYYIVKYYFFHPDLPAEPQYYCTSAVSEKQAIYYVNKYFQRYKKLFGIYNDLKVVECLDYRPKDPKKRNMFDPFYITDLVKDNKQ